MINRDNSPGTERRPELARGTGLRAVIEEFRRVLDKLGAQLEASVEEADAECTAVGGAFRDIAAANQRIRATLMEPALHAVIAPDCTRIDASLSVAVVALQYQDRLAQRVGHIRAGLHHLQDLLRDGTERTYEEWLELLREVENSHEAEQRRLQAVEAASHSSAELFE